MRRRELIATIAGAAAGLLTVFAGAAAETRGKVPRVGLLTLNAPAEQAAKFQAFRDGMRKLGYQEGANILYEVRFAEGSGDQLAAIAAGLIRDDVDIIVTSGHPSIRAAQRASGSVPIVAAIMSDPVEEGFAASYARPGGNITGLAFQDAELVTKRLQILKEAVPPLSQVAALWDRGMPASLLTAAQSAARALGLTLVVLPAASAAEVGEAFDAARRKAQAVLEISSPRFSGLRAVIAASAIAKGMPTVCEQSDFVIAGCLVSYGPSFDAMYGRAAYYVDKILKGARPADLPIEQPTKFELVVNLKTARALGLAIPPTLLAQADKVIE